MKIPIIGPTFESVAQDINSQKTLNMYVIDAGPDARNKTALVPTAGLLEILDLGGVSCRGITKNNGYVYIVVDDSVYKLDINTDINTINSSTLLGTIGTTTGAVKFSNNPTQIMLVDGSPNGYIITIATDAFAVIADTDFKGGTHVVFCDGYFIYNEPNTALIRTSALNDGTSWDALDVGTVESKPDKLVGLAVNKGEVWCFGEETVEVWYDAANALGIPFSPRVGSEIDIGCAAAYSIVEIDDIIMWLDTRGCVVESSYSQYIRNNNTGYAINIVSDESLQAKISSYVSIRDAVATTYIDRGHIIYQITFPLAKKTWCYDRLTKVWTERAYHDNYANELVAHIAEFCCVLNNKLFICGQSKGKLYIMSHDYKDDAGEPIRRIRRTATFSVENKLIGVNKLELRMGSGAATQSGLGSAPVILLRYSHDGGYTWSNSIPQSIGMVGEYGKRIIWNRLGTGSEWIFEFTIVEPIEFSIVDGFIEISEIEEY